MKKYAYIFDIKEPLKPRKLKSLFDKIVAFIILVFCAPLVVLLKIAYILEGILISENGGPLLFYYNAVSGGKIIKKWKFRIIKTKYIDQVGALRGDWMAYSAEWTPESRTFMGRLVKNFYLDEIPQFWSVLIGDMSIVGPRTLAKIHYDRDRAQGNITRFLLRGGLLGLGHINEGTDQMGKADFEYEYVDRYISDSSIQLLKLDLKIILAGF